MRLTVHHQHGRVSANPPSIGVTLDRFNQAVRVHLMQLAPVPRAAAGSVHSGDKKG
jgi:hypothetical protein